MAKTNFLSINDYHATFEGEILVRMEKVRALIHELVPEAYEIISHQIPAFKIGEKFHLMYYCGFKNHLSLSSPWSEAFLKEFEADLADKKVSRAVIQFPLNKPLPVELIERIIKFRYREYLSNPNKKR
jgi:uncharacterized protein YdhG (YjbR/CyaY superfamily)